MWENKTSMSDVCECPCMVVVVEMNITFPLRKMGLDTVSCYVTWLCHHTKFEHDIFTTVDARMLTGRQTNKTDNANISKCILLFKCCKCLYSEAIWVEFDPYLLRCGSRKIMIFMVYWSCTCHVCVYFSWNTGDWTLSSKCLSLCFHPICPASHRDRHLLVFEGSWVETRRFLGTFLYGAWMFD